MTPEQEELRAERIAIMVIEGSTESQAIAFCDSRPELYGIKAEEVKQEFFDYANRIGG